MSAGQAGGSGQAWLHVGTPKTGTTYLQNVLWKNREALAGVGLRYPLERPAEHLHATLDLREMAWNGRRDPAWQGTWERVAGRAQAWPGPRVVLSNELLGGADEEQAGRAVRSLQPREVHLVLTVRDLARQLPSGWQEHVKHRHTVGLDDFVTDCLDRGSEGRFGRSFWRLHDVPGVLRRWQSAVPPERIHLVTVPQAGGSPGLLWRRFATLLGLDPTRYATDVARSNPSLGVVEVELLRRLNESLADHLPRQQYDPVIRLGLAEGILARRPGSIPVVLPAPRYLRVLERSQQLTDQLRSAGYEVCGDLAELLPRPPAAAAAQTPTDEALRDAAVDATAGLIARLGRLEQRSARSRRGAGQAGAARGGRAH